MAGERLLIVEDDKITSQVEKVLLEELGYEVVGIATTGEEAIEKYVAARREGLPFDAVIVDLTVPGGLGGEETLQRLVAIDSGVRAIVSSGYSTDPVMANCDEYGFCGVVSKPYDMEELSAVLHNVLRERSCED